MYPHNNPVKDTLIKRVPSPVFLIRSAAAPFPQPRSWILENAVRRGMLGTVRKVVSGLPTLSPGSKK